MKGVVTALMVGLSVLGLGAVATGIAPIPAWIVTTVGVVGLVASILVPRDGKAIARLSGAAASAVAISAVAAAVLRSPPWLTVWTLACAAVLGFNVLLAGGSWSPLRRA